MDSMTDFVEDFRQTIERATERLIQISEAQSSIPRAAGKWSPKEIIGHLIDSASNNHQRFVRAQFSDDLVFQGYEQEQWVRVQVYNDEPWMLLVQLWRHYNLHLVHVMASMTENARTKLRARHSLEQIAWQTVAEHQPVTLEYLMRDYVDHLRNHLDQVFNAVD